MSLAGTSSQRVVGQVFGPPHSPPALPPVQKPTAMHSDPLQVWLGHRAFLASSQMGHFTQHNPHSVSVFLLLQN